MYKKGQLVWGISRHSGPKQYVYSKASNGGIFHLLCSVKNKSSIHYFFDRNLFTTEAEAYSAYAKRLLVARDKCRKTFEVEVGKLNKKIDVVGKHLVTLARG